MNKPTRIKPVRRDATAETTALVPASGALVAMPVPGAELDRADRVNFFHRLSREAGIVAIRAAIAAGVELLEAKAEHAGGFQSWVKAKCTFGLSTAYKYMTVAEKTLTESRLPALLEGTDTDRENAIEEAATSTDSRTLTDLYTDLGIVKRTPSKMGGARPGAGRPPKAATETSDLETHRKETLHELGVHLAVLDRATGPGGGAVLLPLAALKSLKDELKTLLGRVDEMIKSKLPKGR